MRKSAMMVLFFSVGLFLFYITMRMVSAISQGYAWTEMDWNSDGATSISEFIASSDIGKLKTNDGERSCIEYYSYKDASTIRLDCD
ncbi:hypothetical protein OHA_1_02459 [Pleomorphomonas sp. SM30]|uniref:EF-hand domain-containing protein n=1 Tax=Oharaeibacter diazotrophicus TaxID=1920512 RepID=A0A4R6R9T6_9HYPH|nr:hypothetical protein EDD54_3644 [Oharaeibacter diazotrophicus]BBE72860.1 hypothetical protein OHA_1_02459 [Pleomorphomonas sp. SM30]